MPNWRPLLDLAPEHLDDFMWMFEFELDDGTRVQAFKHRWTRRYLYLGSEGSAWEEIRGGRFEKADARTALADVLREDGASDLFDIVRQNSWDVEVSLDWTRAATKHRISRERSRYVIEQSRCHLLQEPPQEGVWADHRLVFLGDDEGGVPLEVIAVEVEQGLRVIHAMELGRRHRMSYERVKKWQRY